MTQEDKNLLLKDLSARLSYGVICHTEKGDGYLCSIDQTIFGTEYGININPLKRGYFNDSETEEQAIKPYLRTISSMTMEEQREYISVERSMSPDNPSVLTDWLNEHHFDYRGIIPIGLALKAPEDMYKNE